MGQEFEELFSSQTMAYFCSNCKLGCYLVRATRYPFQKSVGS